MRYADVCIAGAGLIGSALALELAARGRRVVLLSEHDPLAQASTAAAGMLAVDDPENPPALHTLSSLSRDLYPAFLDSLETGAVAEPVRLQSRQTLQSLSAEHVRAGPALSAPALHALLPSLRAGDHRFTLLNEDSFDPRELAAAVRARLAATPGVHLRSGVRVLGVADGSPVTTTRTDAGPIESASFVDCTGAWSLPFKGSCSVSVRPRKGQLLTVTLPRTLVLELVVRTASLYIVPRLHGAQAGRAVIGATVEDRGFDLAVEPGTISSLQAHAAKLLPELRDALIAESWAGLRPATPDGLPVLGPTGENTFIAKGHFRNGILLAPATARVMADLITGHKPAIDLAPFSPSRTSAPNPPADA